MAIQSIDNGLHILSFDMEWLTPVTNPNVCNSLYDLTNSSNNNSGPCSSYKYSIETSFIANFELKNCVSMYLYEEASTKMLIVSDGYLGVKLISVNFPASPKLVSEYQTFDA